MPTRKRRRRKHTKRGKGKRKSNLSRQKDDRRTILLLPMRNLNRPPADQPLMLDHRLIPTRNRPHKKVRPSIVVQYFVAVSYIQHLLTEGGFLDFLAKVATDVSQELEIGFTKLNETIDKELHNRNVEGERHFQEEFHLPSTERLLGCEYACVPCQYI